MPNIRSASRLHPYEDALGEMAPGSPAFLAQSGSIRYAILAMPDYERYEPEQALLAQLDLGKRSAQERGALSTEQLRERMGSRFGSER